MKAKIYALKNKDELTLTARQLKDFKEAVKKEKIIKESYPTIEDNEYPPKCRHKWFIGAWKGAIIKGKICKIGQYIVCNKCKKKIIAYDRRYSE